MFAGVLSLTNWSRVTHTSVPGDGEDVPRRGGQAVDASPLDASLRLNVVLEGAVDPRRQVRDVMGLEHQLVERQTERGREEGDKERQT